MNALVIDASIAIKWVVEENGTELALALRQKARLMAPDLIVAGMRQHPVEEGPEEGTQQRRGAYRDSPASERGDGVGPVSGAHGVHNTAGD